MATNNGTDQTVGQKGSWQFGEAKLPSPPSAHSSATAKASPPKDPAISKVERRTVPSLQKSSFSGWFRRHALVLGLGSLGVGALGSTEYYRSQGRPIPLLPSVLGRDRTAPPVGTPIVPERSREKAIEFFLPLLFKDSKNRLYVPKFDPELKGRISLWMLEEKPGVPLTVKPENPRFSTIPDVADFDPASGGDCRKLLDAIKDTKLDAEGLLKKLGDLHDAVFYKYIAELQANKDKPDAVKNAVSAAKATLKAQLAEWQKEAFGRDYAKEMGPLFDSAKKQIQAGPAEAKTAAESSLAEERANMEKDQAVANEIAARSASFLGNEEKKTDEEFTRDWLGKSKQGSTERILGALMPASMGGYLTGDKSVPLLTSFHERMVEDIAKVLRSAFGAERANALLETIAVRDATEHEAKEPEAKASAPKAAKHK